MSLTRTKQLESSRLKGLDALVGPGLVSIPSAVPGVAPTIAPETAIGAGLRTASTSAAGRSAIEAQSALYPGAARMSVLPATGTVGQLVQLPNDSVWRWQLNSVEGVTTWVLVELWNTPDQDRIDATPFLVYNSSAFLPSVPDINGIQRGVNWPQCVADNAIVNGGDYSWRVSGNTKVVLSDRKIILKNGIKYGIVGSVRGTNVSDFYYVFLQELDADGLTVFSYNQFVNPGTETTLAAPLSIGQTSMTINTPTTAWVAGSGAFRYATVYPYSNSKGRVYSSPHNYIANGEPGYYSRNQVLTQTYTANGATATVGLASAWVAANPAAGSGGVWPVGTQVANAHDNAGTYTYPYGARNNKLSWDELTPTNSAGFFCKPGTPGQSGVLRLRYGTESVRFGILVGYGNVNGTTWHSGLDIKPFD